MINYEESLYTDLTVIRHTIGPIMITMPSSTKIWQGGLGLGVVEGLAGLLTIQRKQLQM